MAKYENPKAITGKAETPAAMAREMAHARGIKVEAATDALVEKGYAKVAAELKWARSNLAPKVARAARKQTKAARKPKAPAKPKSAAKVVKAPKIGATISTPALPGVKAEI